MNQTLQDLKTKKKLPEISSGADKRKRTGTDP